MIRGERSAVRWPLTRVVRFWHLPCSDAFREMLESVNQNGHTFEECKKALKESTHSPLA